MTAKTDAATGETESTRPTADHWGQTVEHFEEDGAGEKCECQSCGERFEVALVAATADSWAERWEEFYKCESCGARGTFRFDESQGDARTWTGRMDYPDQ